MRERQKQRWIERFLATVLAMALWLPAHARACPSESGTACCCCCEDDSDDTRTSVENANYCCEDCDVASLSPASRPELARWTFDIAVPRPAETSARLPESHHRLERALARGPPGPRAPIYAQTCSYLL